MPPRLPKSYGGQAGGGLLHADSNSEESRAKAEGSSHELAQRRGEIGAAGFLDGSHRRPRMAGYPRSIGLAVLRQGGQLADQVLAVGKPRLVE